MKRSKFSDSQILSILKQAEAGQVVADLFREHGISSATLSKNTLTMAIHCNNPPNRVMHHSERGVQYCNRFYKEHGSIGSMSGSGI